MAKLVHLSRPSKGVSDAVRAWFAAKCQKRRRRRDSGAAPLVVPAPVLEWVGVAWDATTPNWADVTVGFSFADPGLPEAEFEIYIAPGPGGSDFALSQTIPSTQRQFTQTEVFNNENGVTYQLRYRNGDVVGPFSNSVDANAHT